MAPVASSPGTSRHGMRPRAVVAVHAGAGRYGPPGSRSTDEVRHAVVAACRAAIGLLLRHQAAAENDSSSEAGALTAPGDRRYKPKKRRRLHRPDGGGQAYEHGSGNDGPDDEDRDGARLEDDNRPLALGSQLCMAAAAVRVAVRCLEAVPCTNAARGSNLTVDGTVECDASIMLARARHASKPSTAAASPTPLASRRAPPPPAFGAVGAVRGLVHPVDAAALVMLRQAAGPGLLGRVPPLLLVGDGARRFAIERGAEPAVAVADGHDSAGDSDDRIVDPLATRQATKRWSSAMQMLRSAAEAEEQNSPGEYGLGGDPRARSFDAADEAPAFEDTVGAVAIDSDGNIAAAVSSGGIMLKVEKLPGRVGEAATFGSGVWAQQPTSSSSFGVAVSVSGTGEQIMATGLARAAGETLSRDGAGEGHRDDEGESADGTGQEDLTPGEPLRNAMEAFMRSELLTAFPSRNAGVLALRATAASVEPDGGQGGWASDPSAVEVWYTHTTEGFCVAWMSTDDDRPTVQISRRRDGEDISL
ncbi:taspase, threonine aspartase, 1, partial [Cladochytrium tenue]